MAEGGQNAGSSVYTQRARGAGGGMKSYAMSTLLLALESASSAAQADPPPTRVGERGVAGVALGARPVSLAWYDATQSMVAQYPVAAIPWSNLTHIVYNGGYQPFPNGSLAVGQDRDCSPAGCTSDWICGRDAADCTATLHALRDAAHARGVKVLIGGLDLFEGNTSLAYAWLNSTCAGRPCIEVYAESIASYVKQHQVDGAEFDFEDFGDCSMAEMRCPPGWDAPSVDAYALSQFARLHRLTRAALGPAALMGIDFSTSGPMYTANDNKTLGCFDYFNTMLYSAGESGFATDKAQITAFQQRTLVPKEKLLFGNGLQHSLRGVDLSKCKALTPDDNSCGSQSFTGQALSKRRARWAVQNGYGGAFFFELNYDLLPNDTHSVMGWYAKGLAANSLKTDDGGMRTVIYGHER